MKWTPRIARNLHRIRAAWLPQGQPVGHAPVEHQFEGGAVKAEPFVLSGPAELHVDVVPEAPAARLHLWLVDADEVVQAQTYLDVAPIEVPNRP